MNLFAIRVMSLLAAAGTMGAFAARADSSGSATSAESLVVGALLEDRSNGDRVGITCAKTEVVQVGVHEVESCVEFQFVLTNAAGETLYAKPIGKNLTREAVREMSETRFSSDREDPTSGAASYVGFRGLAPVDSWGNVQFAHPLIVSGSLVGATALGNASSDWWDLLLVLLPATFAVDVVKDAVVYPVGGAGILLADAAIGVRNAASHVVISIRNGVEKAQVKKWNRKMRKAMTKALSSSESGKTATISHDLFQLLVSAVSNCSGTNPDDIGSCESFTVGN